MALPLEPERGLFPEIDDREFVQSSDVAELAREVLAKHGTTSGPVHLNVLWNVAEAIDQGQIRVLYLLNAKPFDPVKDEITHDVIAKAIKAPKLWHDVTGFDAVIWIRAHFWTLFDARKRAAIVLHELMHLQVEYDYEAEEWSLKIRHHDVEEFAAVMRFYGAIDASREVLVKAFGMWEQDHGEPAQPDPEAPTPIDSKKSHRPRDPRP